MRPVGTASALLGAGADLASDGLPGNLGLWRGLGLLRLLLSLGLGLSLGACLFFSFLRLSLSLSLGLGLSLPLLLGELGVPLMIHQSLYC